MEERLSEHLKITGFPYEEKKEEDEVIGLPEITPEMDQVINTAMASRGEVLDCFYLVVSLSHSFVVSLECDERAKLRIFLIRVEVP